MPIPAGVCRCSLVGTVGGSEIFDTSFWVLGGTASLSDTQALADGIAGILTATNAMQNTLSVAMPDTTYTQVRCYAYTAAGTSATWVTEASVNKTGTGTVPAALQVSIVVSLRTQFVGRSRRGRMYLPANGYGLGTDHQGSSGFIATLAEEWATILGNVNAINLPGGGNPSVCVVSQTLNDTAVVNAVIVDSVPDVQRRRANKLAATTVAEAVLS